MGKAKKLRVLKNYRREHLPIKGFRGRDLIFKSKASKILDLNNEEQRAEYYLWKKRYWPYITDVSVLFSKLTGVYPKKVEEKIKPIKKEKIDFKTVPIAKPKVQEQNTEKLSSMTKEELKNVTMRF